MTDDAGQPQYPGTWLLVPELCIYQEGEPPLSGRYQIARQSGSVHITIAWRGHDGSEHETEFGGPEDGTRVPVDAPGVTHLAMRHVSPLILDSSAFRDETEISYARRCASSDGQLLATVQEGTRPDGSSFRNFQVYRRAPARTSSAER